MAKAKKRKSKPSPRAKKKMLDSREPSDKTFGEKIDETGFVQQTEWDAPSAVSRILSRNTGLMSRQMLFFIAAFALIASYFIFRAFAYYPDPPTASITANGQHPSLTVNQGTDVVLNYSGDGQGNNLSSCKFTSGGISPNPNTFGQGSYSGSTDLGSGLGSGTYTYTFTCYSPAGNGSDTVTVTVNGSGGGGGGGGGGGNNCQTLQVTVCISSTPDPIMDGETSTLSWSVSPQTPSHCDKFMAPNSPNSDPNWSGSAGFGGTQDVTPPGPGSYIYAVKCVDGSGNNVGHQGWGVTVNPLPSGCSFNNKQAVNLASCQGSSCNSCAVQARNILAKHFSGYFTDSKGTKRHFRGDGKYNCDNTADCSDLYDTYAGWSIHSHSSSCGADYIHAKVEQLIVNLIETGNYKIGTFALCSDHSNDGGQYGSCTGVGHTCGRAVDISSINGNRIGNSGTKESNVISLDKYIDKLNNLFPVQMISGGYNGSSLDDNLLSLQIYNPNGTTGTLCPSISTCENYYTIAVEQEHENHVHVGEYP